MSQTLTYSWLATWKWTATAYGFPRPAACPSRTYLHTGLNSPICLPSSFGSLLSFCEPSLSRVPTCGLGFLKVSLMASSAPGRGSQLLAANIAFLTTAVITNALRCFVRMKIVKAFGIDDWLMAIATASQQCPPIWFGLIISRFPLSHTELHQ